MKKFLLLGMLAGLAMTAGAQNVKFYYQGNEVPQNQTLVYSDVIYDDIWGEYMIKPDVTLKATSNATVVVKVVCTTGQSVNLCFGGQCGAPSTTVISKQFNMVAGRAENLEYDYASSDPIDYIVSTDVYVMDPISEATVNKITLKFDPNAGSVKGVSADKGVAYSNGNLYFNTTEATSFALYNCAGQKVAGYMVNGTNEFSTANLQPGVYVYTVGGKTGKIFVK